MIVSFCWILSDNPILQKNKAFQCQVVISSLLMIPINNFKGLAGVTVQNVDYLMLKTSISSYKDEPLKLLNNLSCLN